MKIRLLIAKNSDRINSKHVPHRRRCHRAVSPVGMSAVIAAEGQASQWLLGLLERVLFAEGVVTFIVLSSIEHT